MLDYLQQSAVMVQIWGKQKPPKQKKVVNTKDASLSAAMTKGQVQAANTNTKKVDPDKIKYMMEAAMLRKRQQIMEQKLHSMRKMIETAEQHKKKKISTHLIKDIYHAPSADAADKCIALIPLEKDDDDEEVKTLAVTGKKGKDSKSNKSKDSDTSSSSDSDSDQEKEKAKLTKKRPKKEPKEKKPSDPQVSKKVDNMISSTRPGSGKNKKSSACVLL